jgi:demethylmenaquinone methyltransferase/2-methoxy-6-polyprenyl-1,4-benzoquinol methylase
MFSAIADYYDVINSLISFRCDRAWRKFAASKAGIGPGALALDIATGTGELARQLYRRNSESMIVGVDFCPGMLQKARAKFVNSSGAGIVELVLGDALLLPFRESTFECVTIGFGLRNISDIGAAFREIARVTKPGGRVVSLELTRPTSSLIRKLHYLSLFHIVPHIGRLVSGNRDAYTYLPNSIVGFQSPDEVKKTMEEAGLKKVEIYRLTLGIATVHVAVKGY